MAPPRLSSNGTHQLSVATGRVDDRVLRMIRANPRATWRVVQVRDPTARSTHFRAEGLEVIRTPVRAPNTVCLVAAHDAQLVAPPRLSPNGTHQLSVATGRVDDRVLRMIRANPRATWRVVRDRTGLSEANAKRALTAARRKLRDAVKEAQMQGALEPSNAHPNGRDS